MTAKKMAKNLTYQCRELKNEQRAADLLSRMTLEEKVDQLRSQGTDNLEERDYKAGNIRIPYLNSTEKRLSASEYAAAMNQEQRKIMGSNRFHIPALIHDEGLHGAIWGANTVFPQSIALAATWDPEFISIISTAIAREIKAVGIRQVLAPVLNIARDSRWGRTCETYGEDPYLASKIGAAYVKSIEEQGIITTLKHFICNYGDGGRDSHSCDLSWRILREIYLPPFKECIQNAGARSVMAAYNSMDGVPCSCNKKLLTDLLRNEWGFDGIVVSDYFSVVGNEKEGIYGLDNAHHVAATKSEAQMKAIEAGLDVELPNGGQYLLEMVKNGGISEDVIDRAVERVLKLKFALGLFDDPYVDESEADSVVLCREHLDLCLEAARKSIVLLKNDHNLLPLNTNIKRIGIFGPVKDNVSLGSYSAHLEYIQEIAVSPLMGIRDAVSNDTEIIVFQNGQNAEEIAKQCDAVIYFAAVVEDEGNDRSNLELPDETVRLGRQSYLKLENQDMMIDIIASTGVPTIVVLINGSAVVMHRWISKVGAIVNAWYGGMLQGRAIADVLFGSYNPGGKLPLTFPKSSSQVPLYYNFKPSGRIYDYCDMDSEPEFYFGYGLSYTKFEFSKIELEKSKYNINEMIKVAIDVKNTGEYKGDEVVQVYVRDICGSVVTPTKQMRAFKRITLDPGESEKVEFVLSYDDFVLLDQNMKLTLEPGAFKIMVGSSSYDIHSEVIIDIYGEV